MSRALILFGRETTDRRYELLVNGKPVRYRMKPDNKILDAYRPGDEVEFRSKEDGKYHGRYVFLRRENKGDNCVFVFANPEGHEFKYMWWQILALKNKDCFRLSWPEDTVEGPPPKDYEKPVANS